MKQQEEKEPDVVLSIEQWPFLEEQFHAVRGVWAFIHRWAFALLPPDQKHLVASLLQSQARLVDPLVRDQVVNHRYDGAFHGDKGTKFSVETQKIQRYCVFLQA